MQILQIRLAVSTDILFLYFNTTRRKQCSFLLVSNNFVNLKVTHKYLQQISLQGDLYLFQTKIMPYSPITFPTYYLTCKKRLNSIWQSYPELLDSEVHRLLCKTVKPGNQKLKLKETKFQDLIHALSVNFTQTLISNMQFVNYRLCTNISMANQMCGLM